MTGWALNGDGEVEAPGTDAPRGADDDKRVAYLEQLGQTLILSGWYAAVAQPLGEPPFLRITNPALTLLSDTVFCCLAADGTWACTWRWGEPIGPVDDLPGAVERVERVLGAGVEA